MPSSLPRRPAVKVCFRHSRLKLLRADTGSDLLMWTLVENYTHMDLAVIGELNLDSCLTALQLDPPVYSTTSPAELSYGRPILTRLALC